ncbi:MAG: 1-deoxy-D-xylulose-5-phosphate reductoisomerase [Ruminococcus sp.]|nr:1-deoxy-D-xylulose-5-phosphate reductoisomerase [Ruminococcus sp.]
MKTITILGSTGSIGTQSLDVCKKHRIRVAAVSANKNVKLLAQQAKEFEVQYACIADETLAPELEELLAGSGIRVLAGHDGIMQIASLDSVDIMLNSLVGMVGLEPTLAAIEKGTNIALANKETLVAGGKLVINRARRKNVRIYPVDSEHSAIFQCLQGNNIRDLKKIILTASGGPFYGMKKKDLEKVTIEQALSHPNWAMGNKITIDSATMMNKGLEFIEALWLFDLEPEQIEVVVHRQSIVHSAVEYNDNAVIAQLGVADMRIPIQYALLFPQRVECPVEQLSLTDIGTLTFEKPDLETFDCLSACIKAITKGGNLPAAVNGANEEAVGLFLDKKIGFLDIGTLVSRCLESTEYKEINDLSDVLEADMFAREFVRENYDKL